MSTPTPAHLSEAVFRRWEPLLISATQSQADYPVPCDQLSPVTVAAQLRNAIRSVRLYQWPSPLDLSALAIYQVVQDGEQVLIRHRSVQPQPIANTVDQPLFVVPNGNVEVLRALLTLCHHRLFATGIVVEYQSVEQLTAIAELFDVVITPIGGSRYRIL